MKTELIIFHRPNNGLINANIPLGTASTGWTERNSGNYGQVGNPNQPTNGPQLKNKAIGDLVVDGIGYDPNVGTPLPPVQDTFKSGTGQRIDLYNDVDIPITYNILDISDPDKRKTAWSKTITVPGTKANNRTFKHIYQISGDGWVKIGNTSIYQNFNPNLRTEIVLLSDGIQVLKGNLQLKTIKKDASGNMEYEISLTGDLTSLFFDVGTAKLNDLDYSEWDHDWSLLNIRNSWGGLLVKNGGTYSNVTYSAPKIISKMFMDVRGTQSTNRLGIQTTTSHGYSEGDFVRLSPGARFPTEWLETSTGTWCVAEVISSTKFTVNTPYPISLIGSVYYNSANAWVDTLALNPPYGIGDVQKVTLDGTGYVYPLVSWGDEINSKSFPITSMAPSYFMKEIWDKIFDKTNSKYQSNFLNSQFFKRLILTQKKSAYELTAAQIQERQFNVASSWEITSRASSLVGVWAWLNTSTYSTVEDKKSTFNNTNVALGQYSPQTYPFSVDAGFATTATGSVYFFDGIGATGIGPGGNWDSSTYKWNVQKSGDYGVSSTIQLDSWIDINGEDGTGTASITAPFDLGSNNFCKYFWRHHQQLYGGPGGVSTLPYLQAKIILARDKNGVVTRSEMNTVNFVMDGLQYVPSSAGSPMSSSNTGKWPYFGRYYPTDWQNKTISFNTNAYFSKGEKVWVEIKYYIHCRTAGAPANTCMAIYQWEDTDTEMAPYATEIPCNWYLRAKGAPSSKMSLMGNAPSPKSGENSLIFGREFLPKDMTCKDFLKNIIKMFNLHIEPDRQVERLYYIEPRDDYYYTGSNGTSDYTDWTDKMDADSVEIIPMGQLLAKNYIFQNKPETDYWNKRFKEERGRDYMSYTKEIENDFLKNEFKIDVSFGSTVMINNPEKSDVVMPAVIQKEANGSTKPVSNSAPRVLIWSGLRPYANEKGNGIIPNTAVYFGGAGGGIRGWELVSSTTTILPSGAVSIVTATAANGLYPYAGTVDSPLDPYWDINWFNQQEGDFVYWNYARWTNHNLYNGYWKNFIDEVSDPASMVVKADFNLSASDIFDLDFRRIFVVDGVYYRLQKVIDYNPVKDGMTKVELLKLKQPTRFTRRSLWGTEVFETITNLNRPLTTTVVYGPPKSKVWRDASYTNDLPSNLGEGTIAVSGLSNQVGLGTNIVVNGNENIVGEGSSNINITSGNGVVVSGGLKNVNVIGTSNVTITEDNVTYINNVRYKEGVPISRCNIIDGGETGATASTTLALKKETNRNVTITVVDAGEDLVSFAGNSTYENVINAGADSILPDLVELGQTTRTTPNPKTNYTSGADVFLGTASMAEFVRSNRQAFL